MTIKEQAENYANKIYTHSKEQIKTAYIKGYEEREKEINVKNKKVIFMVKNIHENNRIIEAFELTMNSPEELYEFENEYNDRLNDYEWLDYEIRR